MLTLTAFLTTAPALAQERLVPADLPNPVTLNITGAETGDRGCYIGGTQATPTGIREWSLMGQFGCEEELLVGRTYVLEWSEQNVLAGVCEGDIDCGLSDVEAVVFNATQVDPEPLACQGEANQVQLNNCASAKAQEAQLELDALLEAIRFRYSQDQKFLASMKRAQAAWQEYRSAQIAARYPHADEPGHYGSVYPMCLASYEEELIRRRIAELQPWIEGIEEGDMCTGSVGRPRP